MAQIVRTQNIPTGDQKAALDAASNPSAINPVATIADIPAGGNGDVLGPASAVAGNLPILDETGKILSDSGYDPTDFSAAGHDHSGTYEPADAAIQSHIGTTGNPHGTTYSDVGAAASGHDHSGTYEPANSNIQGHIEIVAGNPHGTTAADVGASATGHDHSGVYEPADSDIQTHIGLTSDNPHGTDYTDVGAAPAVHNHTSLTDVVSIAFNTAPTPPTHAEGQLYWDAADRTLAVDMGHTGVTLQVGQEQFVRVFNNTGAPISDGRVVYISGVSGNRPTVALADADTEATQYVLGVVTHTLDATGDGRYGYCTVHGIVRGIDTQGFTAGLPLWLSSTAGEMTNIRPAAPLHAVYIGTALNSTGNGSIFVHPGAGHELDEAHDVAYPIARADGQALRWHGTNLRWENAVLSPSDVGAAASGHDHSGTYEPSNANIQTHIGLTSDNPHGTDKTDVGLGNVTNDAQLPILYAQENHAPSGFHSHTETTLSLTENVGAVNDTFRVTITGTNFPVYCDGVRRLKNTEYIEQVGATTRRYYIFYNAVGTLTISSTSWNLESGIYDGSAPVCTVYWDATTHQGILEEERHHSWRDVHWHHWAHDSVGARYVSGFGMTKPVASADIADFSISQGEQYDEDIALLSNASPQTTCTLWYHSGANMVFERNSATLFKSTAGVPQYDNGTGLAGKTRNNSTGYFVSWIYGTNSYADTTRIAAVVGQDSDGTMTLAEAQAVGLPTFPVGFVIEWKLLYKIIWRYGLSSTTWISTTDYRTSSSLPGGTVPVSSVVASSVVYAAGGNIAATNVQSAIEELDTEKISKADYDAQTILIAITNDTPTALTVGEATVVGRLAGGNISTIPIGASSGNVAAGNHTHTITDRLVAVFDGGGSEIADNKKAYVSVPFTCTITACRMLAAESGSMVVDIWKDTYANYPPMVADTITASAKPTITSAAKSEDATLTGWTTAITAGDVLCFNVDSCTTITWASIILTVTRSV